MNAATHAFTPTPAAPLDVPAHVSIAAKSGCSTKAFVGIFGGNVDLAEHDGWRLAMERGAWVAKRGTRTLRSPTLGGIHAAVKKASRKRSTAASLTKPPRSDGYPVTVEARGGEGRVEWDAAKGGYVWEARDGEGSAPHALPSGGV